MTALVVLPGLDGTATMHAEFVAAVRPWFEAVPVVAYPQDRILSYAELEVFVRASLPEGSPFVLLGESFSGPIALSIAANPPPGLVGLVLSTTFARSPVPLLSPLASLMRLAPVRSVPMTLFSWLLLGPWATAQRKTELQDALKSVDPDVLRSRAAAALRVDVSATMGRVALPTLYLRATKDRLLVRRAATELSRSLSNLQVVDIEGPHLLLQANPSACARTIGAFVEKLILGSAT